jgi:hypothetical protein
MFIFVSVLEVLLGRFIVFLYSHLYDTVTKKEYGYQVYTYDCNGRNGITTKKQIKGRD